MSDLSVIWKRNSIIKVTSCLMGFISCGFMVSIAQAQTNPSGGINNTLQNSGFPLSPRQFNDIRPLRQQNFLLDSGSGSQQFFRQGREQLYLLPEEQSEPILRIDKTIEAEGINYEDLQPKPNKK